MTESGRDAFNGETEAPRRGALSFNKPSRAENAVLDARQKRTRRLAAFIVIGVVLLVIAAYVGWERWERASAIDAALSWTLMNPIPGEAKDVDVKTKGTMFTREFIVTFELSAKQMELWLKGSPGTKSVIPTMDGPWEVYQIRGSQAQFAEVRVNRKTGQVRIRTYWS